MCALCLCRLPSHFDVLLLLGSYLLPHIPTVPRAACVHCNQTHEPHTEHISNAPLFKNSTSFSSICTIHLFAFAQICFHLSLLCLSFCLLRQYETISSFILSFAISFCRSRPWSRQYVSNDMIVNTSYTVSIITFVYFETTNNMLIIARDVIHRPLRYHPIFGANNFYSLAKWPRFVRSFFHIFSKYTAVHQTPTKSCHQRQHQHSISEATKHRFFGCSKCSTPLGC